MASPKLPTGSTYTYMESSTMGHDLDLYLPPPSRGPLNTVSLRPTIVYFHGGGLTVGEKTSWFPFWIYAMASGFAFISANYQLVPPATGYQILEDIKRLFEFIDTGINDLLAARGQHDRIDVGKIAVVGTSAGGLCAYLAGIHASPKPRAILTMYGMGGDFFTPHYLTPKTSPFFRGRELLDPETFSEFLFPNSADLPPTSSSPLSYYGSDHPIPGYPSNPRMLLARLYMQLGNFLDYYTGQHQPSVSEALRARRDQLSADSEENQSTKLSSLFSPVDRSIFPQLNVSAFPPTFFIHGSEDTAVPAQESRSLHKQLELSGIVSILRICDGMEHSFDYSPGAQQQWSSVFDEAFCFIRGHLLSGTSSEVSDQAR